MAEDLSHMPEKIWSLTLEFICLLTGEKFPVRSGDHVTMSVSPPPSWTLERLSLEKILKITTKITELLMGEIPLGSSDISVSVSMEQRESLEGHKEGYSDSKMEDEPFLLSPERSPHFRDSSLEGRVTLQRYQTGIKEEALVLQDNTDAMVVKVEPSSCPVTPESSPIGGYRDRGSDEWIMGQESSRIINKRSQQSRIDNVINSDMSSDCKAEEDDSLERIILFPKFDKTNIQKSQLLGHDSVNTEKPFACLQCDKRFPCKSQLFRHERIHSGVKPFSCIQCKKCFASKSQLVRHERVHTGEKPYSCMHCGKCFPQNSQLVRHERVHTGEKPFSCGVCGKCFSQKSTVSIHHRIHSGVKPYMCLECGKCFVQKGHLVSHEQVHSGVKSCS